MTAQEVKSQGKPEKSIHLRVIKVEQGQELMMSMEEKSPGEEITLQQYIRADISLSSIQTLCKEIFSLLHHSTGNNGKGNAQRLKEVGQHLYDYIFPFQIKEKLAFTHAKDLYLFIDDSLVDIPWEVLYDGESFLSLRFNMGRLVTTAQPISRSMNRDPEGKIKMLILADPRKDLPDSYQEGVLLSERLEAWDDSLEIYLDTTHIDFKKIFRQIPQFDIIHYAGHAIYNEKNPGLSGWYLEDGVLTAQDIIKISGGKKNFPFLIFSNACKSGHTTKWSTQEPHLLINRAFDLVNVFLRCGVQHYIGTFQDISDPVSLDLALSFYHFMIQPCSVGESLRQARLHLINRYGEDNLIWAFYMLYGDPTISYFGQQEESVWPLDQTDLQQKPFYKQDKKKQRYRDQVPKEYQETEKISHVGPAKRTRTPNAFECPVQVARKQPRNKISKKWMKSMGLLIGGVFLFFSCFMLIYFFIHFSQDRHSRHDSFEEKENPEIDLAWEKEKWRIVQDIQAKLNQRYLDQQIPTNMPLSSHGHLTICIIPAIPQWKEKAPSDLMTSHLLEELNLFWIHQSGFMVVERDRLDFVLEELERATSKLTERQLRFTVGKIFGAKGILFVRAIPENPRSPLPFFRKKTKAFIRYVDTETSVIKAMAETSLNDIKDIKRVSQALGEEILQSLKTSGVR